MFYLDLYYFFLVFFLWNKLYIKAEMPPETLILRIQLYTFLHFSYQVEAFNGCYDKLCWFLFE